MNVIISLITVQFVHYYFVSPDTPCTTINTCHKEYDLNHNLKYLNVIYTKYHPRDLRSSQYVVPQPSELPTADKIINKYKI